jgi:hypothetical protein
MKEEDLTQEYVDTIHPLVMEYWNKLLNQSGKSELMFKISHEAMQFMGQYQMMKEEIESRGFTMPEMFGEGTKITLS